MKILYGITKSNFGGAQRYVFDLAKAAKSAGHDVAVLCGGEGTLVKELERNHIRVISLPHLKRDISIVDELRSLHFIFRTLVSENPDIFHTNSSKMGGIGNFAARLAGVKKIIFTAHGWAFNEPRPLYQRLVIKFFVWLTILLSDKTICVSEKSKRDVMHFPLIASRVKVVHNGTEAFELLPRTNPEFTVGTLAELHQVKGLDVLLKAWNKFIKNRRGRLVIFGTGEERASLERLSSELGISDTVIFKGYVENARSHLSDFDIFVLPSRSENLPYALLEAGLASLAVIASRVGGMPEVIETGMNGILVEPENVEELYSSLILLAEDQNLRERLGEKLKETVLENFSLEQMVHATLNLYK